MGGAIHDGPITREMAEALLADLKKRDPEIAQWLEDMTSDDATRRVDAVTRTTTITGRLSVKLEQQLLDALSEESDSDSSGA